MRAVAVVTVTGFIGGAVSVSLASSAAAACAAGQLAGPSRVGRFAGIVHPVRISASCTPKAAGDPANGTAPLIFHGGAVMSTPSTGDKVVVTPIYWGSFAGSYKKIIDRYLPDAAADSEKTTNVFSTLFEYHGSNGHINYHFKRGAPINDANAFPSSGCTVNTGSVYSDGSGYSSCLDDAQVTAEILSVMAANSLKFGITPEEAGGGSPDVAWLLAGDGGEAHLYAAGDRLPIGIEAFPGREHNDLVLWVESVGALIPGDTLVDFGRGLEINEWLRGGVTREQVVERLRPLLALPVEVVLPAHGAPTDRAALERALS